MKALRRNVSETLARLRLEAEKLQREDEVIRDQEDKLRAGYEQLEQKHGQYREKGEYSSPCLGVSRDADGYNYRW
jgi:hypothetical protein